MDWHSAISPQIRTVFEKMKRPMDVQDYLDLLYYDGADINRTVVEVIDQQRSHCLDGAILGALGLRFLGYRPLLIDLVPAPNTDDDHVLALFQRHGGWGAVGKSNYVGLRYREPIHRTLRELVMTYFEPYYSFNGKRTLRGYTRILDLSRFDHLLWWDSHTGLENVINRLYSLEFIPLLNPAVIPELTKVDKRTYDAGMLGINLDGVYRPDGNDEEFPRLIT